jgi:hypothetical protein
VQVSVTGRQPRLEALSLSLRVHRRRRELDRLLAEGASPSASPELELRARQLTKPTTRNELANLIANLIDAAEEPAESWQGSGTDPPLRSQAVLDASPELAALADRLRSPRPASTQGLALVARLVWDEHDSPIFAHYHLGDVADRTRQAREAIDNPSERSLRSSRDAARSRAR